MSELTALQNAGLGWKKVVLPMDGSSQDVHRAVTEAFPAITDTGYELLRAGDAGTKNLQVIQSPAEGLSVGFLKKVLNQAKCYLPPIQSDLPLDTAVPEVTFCTMTICDCYTLIVTVSSTLKTFVSRVLPVRA